MNNYVDGNNMPMGLGMALAQNLEAMNHFASLDSERQQEIINHTHDIRSKQEMQMYVSNIAKDNTMK